LRNEKEAELEEETCGSWTASLDLLAAESEIHFYEIYVYEIHLYVYS